MFTAKFTNFTLCATVCGLMCGCIMCTLMNALQARPELASTWIHAQWQVAPGCPRGRARQARPRRYPGAQWPGKRVTRGADLRVRTTSKRTAWRPQWPWTLRVRACASDSNTAEAAAASGAACLTQSRGTGLATHWQAPTRPGTRGHSWRAAQRPASRKFRASVERERPPEGAGRSDSGS